MVARHDKNVDPVVILKMEKKIVEGCDYCVLMALYMPPTLPPPIAAIASMFPIAGGCVLPPSVFSSTALKQ